MQLSIPVSPGELLDKLTILDIKSERIADSDKRINVRRELELLEAAWQHSGLENPRVAELRAELKRINQALWDIEDNIRLCEKQGDFGDRFVELARAVYVTNDERAAVKRQINQALGSTIVEEKSYQDYKREQQE